MNMMKRKLLLIGVSVSMLIGAVSVAASSGVELHEFFNAKGERVMYPYPLGFHTAWPAPLDFLHFPHVP